MQKKFEFLSQVCKLNVVAFANEKKEIKLENGDLYFYKKTSNRFINYFKIIFLSLFSISKIIKRKKIEVVSFQDPVSSFLSMFIIKMRHKNIKVIVETHGDFIETLGLEKNLIFPRIYRKLFIKLASYTIKNADIIRAVSSSTEAQVQKMNKTKKIVRFPAWVDFDDFKDIEINRVNTAFQILFIGSVTDRKKPHLIIEAMKLLKKENIELLIVGPMPNAKYLSFLKNLISDHGLEANVKFFGEVDRKEVKSFYSKINLMILPSVSEGLARVIFESQATACPVLVTDAPGMGDIVIDGQTGYVFESNNVESLAKKIQYIEENYDEAMHVGRNAKDFILNNYSAENFKFSFKKIFDTV
jgi:glycosyltransferase involved in cell wall biosynthesis